VVKNTLARSRNRDARQSRFFPSARSSSSSLKTACSVAASTAGHRFVHEVDVPRVGQCSRQKMFVAAGRLKLADLLIGVRPQSNLVQALLRPFAIARTRAGETIQPAVGAHQHDIQHFDRKIPIDALPLWHVSDSLATARHGLIKNNELRRSLAGPSENCLDQRALARAVWSDTPTNCGLSSVRSISHNTGLR